MDIRIDEEFRRLIPSLTKEEYEQLEQNILQEGCRDALVVWEGIILDGHNRYKICNKHGIEYRTTNLEFESKEDAKDWMDKNQLGRRNLTPDQRNIIIGRRYNREKKSMSEAGSMKGKSLDQNDLSFTADRIAKDSGVSAPTVRRYAKAAQFFNELEEQSPEIANKVWSGEMTLKEVKKEKRKIEVEDIKRNSKPIPIPDGLFNVIYADPPWEYNNSGFTMSVANKYPTMPTDEICNMEIPKTTDNAVLFMWVTNPLLKDGLKVIESWGFEYKTNIVWTKKRHTAGFYVFGQHELLLIAVKGSMLPHGEKIKSVVSGDNDIHSKKPYVFYTIIEQMYPNKKYVELFARNKKEGWESWGNQCEK